MCLLLRLLTHWQSNPTYWVSVGKAFWRALLGPSSCTSCWCWTQPLLVETPYVIPLYIEYTYQFQMMSRLIHNLVKSPGHKWHTVTYSPTVTHKPSTSYLNSRGGVRSTRGLGPTMTARGQSIGISIGMKPQTLIMSRLDQLSRLGARI